MALPAAKFPLAQGFALAFQDLLVLNHPPNKVQSAPLRATGDGINKNQEQ